MNLPDYSVSPFVSIIIVNYNGLHYLPDCLGALSASLEPTRGLFAAEIILVDNASTDGSVGWARGAFPDVRILDLETNLGFGRANHKGADAALGKMVVFLNSDTVVTAGWLWPLLEPLQTRPDIAATCSALLLLDHPELLNARGGGMTMLGFGHDRGFGMHAEALADRKAVFPLGRKEEETLFPTAAAMAMRREEFLDFGFDEAMFMYHEDVDLGWRIWLAGKRVVVCDDSRVYHKFGGTSAQQKGLPMRHFMGSRHNLRSLWKNYEPGNALLMTLRLMRIWRSQSAYRTLALALGWNARWLPDTLGRRRLIQGTRKITDAELFRRDLIFRCAWPPEPPRLPSQGTAVDPEQLFPGNVLHPGEYSGDGRIGSGWYGRVELDGELVRPLSDRAGCVLKTAPGTSGRLEIQVHVPQKVSTGRRITANCNGQTTAIQATGRKWDSLSLPVRSDTSGLLRVEIQAGPTWMPDAIHGDGNRQLVGCLVREIRFVPDQSGADFAVQGATPQRPRASVIIPTYNRVEILEMCLHALNGQDCDDFEVIVIDDGSSDATWATLGAWQTRERRFELTILRQANAGPGAARNLGLDHARHEIVIIIGDDIIAASDYVRTHLEEHARDPDWKAVVGFTDWHREEMCVGSCLEFINVSGHQFGYRHMREGRETPFTCFYTSNISLPRAALAEERFNPGFTSAAWEDVDLGYRLQRRGLRIVYAPQARVRHLHPMTLRDFYNRQRGVGRTIRQIYELHPELRTAHPILPNVQGTEWIGLFHGPLRPLVTLLDHLDRKGARLPDPLLDRILRVAFCKGLREAE